MPRSTDKTMVIKFIFCSSYEIRGGHKVFYIKKKKILNLKIRKNTSLKGYKEAREPKLERQFEDAWPDCLHIQIDSVHSGAAVDEKKKRYAI